MKNMLKNLNIGGLLALVAGVVLMVSWKAVESNKAVSQWYAVEDTGSTPGNPENQQVTGLYPGGSPTFPCSQSSGIICAIELTTDLEFEEMPKIVADLQDHEDVTVGASRFSNP